MGVVVSAAFKLGHVLATFQLHASYIESSLATFQLQLLHACKSPAGTTMGVVVSAAFKIGH